MHGMNEIRFSMENGSHYVDLSYKTPRMCSTGNAMMKYGAMIRAVHIHALWRIFCLSSSAAICEGMGVNTGLSLKMNRIYRLVLSPTSISITAWDRSRSD